EHTGIGFGAAEAKARRNRQRHLIAAMRKHAGTRPTMLRQHLKRAGILYNAVRLRRIDLDDVVALGSQAAEADKVLDVLGRKQVLAGREWRPINGGNFRKQRKVEWITRLLKPAQAEWLKPARIGERGSAVEFRIGVDRELCTRRQDRFHRRDAGEVLVE